MAGYKQGMGFEMWSKEAIAAVEAEIMALLLVINGVLYEGSDDEEVVVGGNGDGSVCREANISMLYYYKLSFMCVVTQNLSLIFNSFSG